MYRLKNQYSMDPCKECIISFKYHVSSLYKKCILIFRRCLHPPSANVAVTAEEDHDTSAVMETHSIAAAVEYAEEKIPEQTEQVLMKSSLIELEILKYEDNLEIVVSEDVSKPS